MSLTVAVPFPCYNVINLATQKLISTYSKASHFNIHESNAHIPDTSLSHDGIRDEIGLLRAIAVKERSSAKRIRNFSAVSRSGTRPIPTGPHGR
ncbi:hypothetical protein B0H14DRAFT_3466205 [Mycena olivaceomarginata]|nr:hypothetical protein B0H14DRAFT_3466205 [Mycena olivaceomarginata]